MAPVLSGVWWGPEASVVGPEAADSGAALWWAGGPPLVAAVLSALTVLLLVSVLLLLCAGCQGQTKAVSGHEERGDHENLVNGGSQVSEKEAASPSADSPATDVAVSSSRNGPLTSGTILTDTRDSSPQASEEMLSSQSELRSSKCPQDRRLPSIPASSAPAGDGAPPSGDSTYEVVTEMAAASRDVSAEDSLYETVKELKDPPAPPGVPPALLNGQLGPGGPERRTLCSGAEYASIDLRKKSRHSADMESKRRSAQAGLPARAPRKEPEKDLPPPLPEKVLDESGNQAGLANGSAGAGLHNGELDSPPSPGSSDPPAPSHLKEAVYSSVNKNREGAAREEDKEHDYSSIGELKGLDTASSSSDLYATVRDVCPRPRQGDPPASDGADPGYEAIRVPGEDAGGAEPDYESVEEAGLARDVSRL